MIFDFRFWRYFANQQELIDNLESATMRDFKKRVWMVGFFGLLLFIAQELWGLRTESLTNYFVQNGSNTYLTARLASLVGIVIWAIVYMAFHFFGIAFLLNKITSITLSKLAVLQLYVVAILLIEKAVLFIIFIMLGVTTNVSLFSFGPLASIVFDQPFILFFFNQLSIFTALIIALQYRFIRAFTEMNPRIVLLILIVIHLLMAMITSAVGSLPLEEWFNRFVEGGNAQ